MDMIGRIRRMHSRGKKSEREISRATEPPHNTVAKWLHEPLEGAPKYRRSLRATKLTPYHEALKQALKADAHRARHERRTARALYAEIKATGYEGGYTRVTDFIREWRQGEGQGVLTNAFVPLAFELGEAFQFDWSEEGQMPTSATLPAAGRRESSRRTYRTADDVSGSMRPSSASAHSSNSTRGLVRGAARCGRRCTTPSTSSASPATSVAAMKARRGMTDSPG